MASVKGVLIAVYMKGLPLLKTASPGLVARKVPLLFPKGQGSCFQCKYGILPDCSLCKCVHQLHFHIDSWLRKRKS